MKKFSRSSRRDRSSAEPAPQKTLYETNRETFGLPRVEEEPLLDMLASYSSLVSSYHHPMDTLYDIYTEIDRAFEAYDAIECQDQIPNEGGARLGHREAFEGVERIEVLNDVNQHTYDIEGLLEEVRQLEESVKSYEDVTEYICHMQGLGALDLPAVASSVDVNLKLMNELNYIHSEAHSEEEAAYGDTRKLWEFMKKILENVQHVENMFIYYHILSDICENIGHIESTMSSTDESLVHIKENVAYTHDRMLLIIQSIGQIRIEISI